MDFNPAASNIMLLDINSCFATIEQQANPFLRGKPIAVAAYTTSKGCILASSVEAKKFGIKTGMMVAEGKQIYPKLIVLPPDPDKYRDIHLKLKNLLLEYSPEVTPKSIDEFILKPMSNDLVTTAVEIKKRIRLEIGDWISVSIGIAPNRYLAKIAAGFKKPDGLTEINKTNYLDIYKKLELTDLTGIKRANATRLNLLGIYSVMDFYNYNKPVLGGWWNLRLRGYEVDEFESKRGTYGNSVALGENLSSKEELAPILARLTEKMLSRLRADRYRANGIHLMLTYKNGSLWHKGRKTSDLYKGAFKLLQEANPKSPVLNIAVSCYSLSPRSSLQLDFFNEAERKENLFDGIDEVNRKWGEFTLTSARSVLSADAVKDRIAFGQSRRL